MIQLTRLGGQPLVLNAELIKYVEELPDTYVTLVDGERIVVAEPTSEVVRRAIEYQQHKLLLPVAGMRLASTPPS